MKKMQKWKCKVLFQWGKDFHYFIILYLNHLWTLDVQALEISLPLKNRDCSLVTHGYIQLPEISRPWKEQGSTLLVAPGNIHVLKLYRPWKKTRDCTASRYWKYPGPGKIQGVSLGAPWNFPGGKKRNFSIAGWLAILVWILEEKIFLKGILW